MSTGNNSVTLDSTGVPSLKVTRDSGNFTIKAPGTIADNNNTTHPLFYVDGPNKGVFFIHYSQTLGAGNNSNKKVYLGKTGAVWANTSASKGHWLYFANGVLVGVSDEGSNATSLRDTNFNVISTDSFFEI